ncbi:unnamed protein product [Soboliphyme baturini]|uniref:OB_NTP_bind domain-containing protein n=1 Tax=Soboliphyme baturini TaxID=241478 RepID=A0A183JAP4_9BILA|nr:unnamed protein product [Soboliphyme baturini]
MALTVLLKKAGERANNVLANLGIVESKFPGKDGDMIYSKNNICVHPPSSGGDMIQHVPGYLTIHCQQVQNAGITLTLQWLPNESLEKNPARINTMSPRSSPNIQYVALQSHAKLRNVSSNKTVLNLVLNILPISVVCTDYSNTNSRASESSMQLKFPLMIVQCFDTPP